MAVVQRSNEPKRGGSVAGFAASMSAGADGDRPASGIIGRTLQGVRMEMKKQSPTRARALVDDDANLLAALKTLVLGAGHRVNTAVEPGP
jgi:hypothetical protein